MSFIDPDAFTSIREKLSRNAQAREKYGALLQDFSVNGRRSGEIFYGNLMEEEFQELPLRTKRKAGPAYVARLLSEESGGMSRVFEATYEKRYGDKRSFAVYVHTYELDMLGIEY